MQGKKARLRTLLNIRQYFILSLLINVTATTRDKNSRERPERNNDRNDRQSAASIIT